MLYYLPGCDLNRNHPEAGKKMQEYMKMRGAAIAPCCKFDLSSIEKGAVLVQNCTQCDLVLHERRPDLTILSTYEFVLNDAAFPWADFGGKSVTIQDCFRTRENASLQHAVRECLRRSNVRFTEAPNNHRETTYCGVWLNNPADPVVAAVAPRTFEELAVYRHVLTPQEQKESMEAQVKSYETQTVAVYCNGCEKGLRLGGGDPLHLIEVLAAGL
ncbi:MAG: hypothetical protein K5772_03190 [Clostridia bacterium]|nr:hypothetical protein [Clostridia bacterium]